MKRSFRRLQAGFTLLEIMLVVMIIALLAGSAIYFMGDSFTFAADSRVKADLRSVQTSLQMYRARDGHFPTTEQGLKALVTQPESEPRPRNWTPLMTEIPRDPWQIEYKYERPGKSNPNGYDLYSAGPDNKPGTADDIRSQFRHLP